MLTLFFYWGRVLLDRACPCRAVAVDGRDDCPFLPPRRSPAAENADRAVRDRLAGALRARGYRDRQIERYFEEERKRQEAVELRRLACTERLLTCSSFLEQRDEVRSCRGRS
jgi:hypothetical protein